MRGKKEWIQSGIGGFLLVFVLFAVGCSHALHIRNIDQITTDEFSTLERITTIGITSPCEDLNVKKLIKGVGDGLGKRSAKVLLPYDAGSPREVDVVACIDITPEYSGSGWNFLINFPGFLVFAPAWNGYVYNVIYNVDVRLTGGRNNREIAAFTIPVDLDIRHAAINRTWTEISWFEWGVIAFVGGIAFIGYDDGVTPLVADAVKTPLGDYIAQEIVSRLNGYGDLRHVSGP